MKNLLTYTELITSDEWLSCWSSFHQNIFAGGTDPTVWQWILYVNPALSCWVLFVMVTLNGATKWNERNEVQFITRDKLK